MFITMGFGDTCLKIITGIFQTAFAIVGLALVGYGCTCAYIILKINSEQVVSNFGTVIPSAVTVVFGVILVILIVVGCCGICRESTCCLESYAALLTILAFSQLAFGAYCIIVYSDNQNYTQLLHNQIKTDIDEAVKYYKDYPQFNEMMDNIQEWMRCCGSVSPLKEYNFYVGDLPNNSELPLSCCSESAVTCTKNSEMLYEEGCSEKVAQFTYITNQIMGWISIIVGTTELIAALFGLCLSCCMWRMQRGS